MSTATTDPTAPTDQAQDHLPVALWRRYRWHRGRNERPEMAVGLALDDCGYTSQRTREPLRELLISRERGRGLGSTEAEQDQEIALEALEAEAGGPVVPAEPELGSVEAVRRAARAEAIELEAAKARLAPAAIGPDPDPDVLAELESIQAKLAHARATSELTDLADRENARVAREAAEEAERQHRETENAAAAKLEPAVRKQKAAVDRALAAGAAEVAKLSELQDRHSGHLVGGGLDDFSARGVRFRADEVESAIRFHFRGVGLFSRVAGRDEALAPEVKG